MKAFHRIRFCGIKTIYLREWFDKINIFLSQKMCNFAVPEVQL